MLASNLRLHQADTIVVSFLWLGNTPFSYLILDFRKNLDLLSNFI